MRTKAKTLHKLLLSLLWLLLVFYGFYFVFSAVEPYLAGHKVWQSPEFSPFNLLLLASILLLMLVNWAIEAIKWQLAINDLEKQGFLSSFRATLVGVAVSSYMPNRLGEYIGKVFYVLPKNRFKGAISALYVSYTQIIATLFFGLLGAIFFLVNFQKNINISWLGAIILLLLVSMLVALKYKERLLNRLRFGNKYIRLFLHSLMRYSQKQAWVFIGLSALRFCVFTIQFILCLLLFGVEIQLLHAFLLISLIYGLQTIIPSTALAGLGIRGTLSLFFLGFLSSSEMGILSASYFLWMVNLFLPSIFGWFALVFSPVRQEVKVFALQWFGIKSKSH